MNNKIKNMQHHKISVYKQSLQKFEVQRVNDKINMAWLHIFITDKTTLARVNTCKIYLRYKFTLVNIHQTKLYKLMSFSRTSIIK